MIKKFIKHKVLLIWISLIIVIMMGLVASMHITMSPDETFSMSLIRYPYFKMISLDSLDVHPPLYYLILKLFLTLTTFYTSSLAIKVIFARMLSVIFSIITFCILYKIIKYIGIKQNVIISLILFAIIPYNITMLQPYVDTDIGAFTNIRMYSLAFMLITIEFYELLKFKYTEDTYNVFLATIFASLASYTHNLSAVIAGIMILAFLFSIRKNKLSSFIKLFISGIVFAVLYLPWLPLSLKQVRSMPSIKENKIIYLLSKCKQMLFSKAFILFVAVLILLSIPFICKFKDIDNKFKSAIKIVFLTLLISFILMVILSPDQKILYMYPIFGIYVFISLSGLFYYFNYGPYKNYRNIILVLLFITFVSGCYTHYKQYNNKILYTSIYNTVNNRNKKVYLNSAYPNNPYSVINLNNDAAYAENHGKFILNINKSSINLHLAATQSNELKHYIYDNPLEKW